jgi:Raf kinase inhibitor-like YbhB/YbcL family protein
MLEHIPAWLGHVMREWRAGADAVVIAQPDLASAAKGDTRFATLDLSSPAFGHEARLPQRFTADGEGVSPPLVWSAAPAGTTAFALIVEDADAPTPQPLVHAVVWNIPADIGHLSEGAIVADGDGHRHEDDGVHGDVGRNSYFREGWLPPDPPTGHGEHRYIFQLFALDTTPGDPGASPGRSAFVAAITGHVLAAGILIGT